MYNYSRRYKALVGAPLERVNTDNSIYSNDHHREPLLLAFGFLLISNKLHLQTESSSFKNFFEISTANMFPGSGHHAGQQGGGGYSCKAQHILSLMFSFDGTNNCYRRATTSSARTSTSLLSVSFSATCEKLQHLSNKNITARPINSTANNSTPLRKGSHLINSKAIVHPLRDMEVTMLVANENEDVNE